MTKEDKILFCFLLMALGLVVWLCAGCRIEPRAQLIPLPSQRTAKATSDLMPPAFVPDLAGSRPIIPTNKHPLLIVTNVTPSWDYPPADFILFEVRSTNQLGSHPTNWPVVTLTSNKFYTTPATGSAGWFAVRATNLFTHMVSDFARR